MRGHSHSIVACLAAVLFIAGCATTTMQKPALTPEQRQLNIASFEYVWATIRDKHYDPTFGGLDWQAVHDELRPKVENARTMSGARRAMREMIDRLGLTHFGIIPAKVYEAMDSPAEKGSGGGITGMSIRIIDGKPLVTRVEKGSPAAVAGVKTGWEIVRIREDSVSAKLRQVAEEFEGKPLKNLALTAAVQSRLTGSIGDSVAVGFLDGRDRAVDLNVSLVEKKGRRYKLGHMPTSYIWTEVDTLDGNIGYIAFNAFMDPMNVMPTFNNAMKTFMDARGLIIDLRGNPGGIGAMAIGMAGWLIPEKNRYLGTMSLRNNELKFIVNPRATVYTGPLAVLVDGLSTSCSEIFSGGLKDLGRARIFGARTGGAALPSMIEKLPNGDGFQYAFANYRSESGKVLEGAGVVPDIEILPTRAALLLGRDLVLETAASWIQAQTQGK